MILSDRYLGSTCSNLIYFSFLGVLDPCEQYYTQHTSKFRNFLNKASAMLTNAFNNNCGYIHVGPGKQFMWTIDQNGAL